MAILNEWQRITRVLPGKPFGDGADGAYSSATIPTIVYGSVATVASGNTGITVSVSTFADGDVVMIHQSRGTGVGQWEINQVISGGGTTSLVLKKELHYSYTDSGASQAQIIKIPRYTDITVQSGTWSVGPWAGNIGGILPIASNGTVTSTGGVSNIGNNGSTTTSGTVAGGAGRGFIGGSGKASTSYPLQAGSGEGHTAASVDQTAANGSGGGGGRITSAASAGGGGGGHAASGSTGTADHTAGTGGGTSGAADLTSATFGGGGGGATKDSVNTVGSGGGGGGMVFLFANNIADPTGTWTTKGGDGAVGGGGGAGGSILIVCQTATLGTSKFLATAGSGAAIGARTGGNGSVGRIAVHHSGSVTGTTSPTFTDVEDSTLKESGGGFFSFL